METEYTKYKLLQLKKLCREKNLKISGNKQTLIDRLNNPDEPSNKARKNKGEKGEVYTIQHIYQLNKDMKYKELVEIFGNQASEGITILDPITKHEIDDPENIKKAISSCKADCIIRINKTNQIFCASIKSKDGAKPAIMNHTHRGCNIFKENGILHFILDNVDTFVKEYIDKRSTSKISEDVSIKMFETIKNETIFDSICKLLIYFSFQGTGKGPSILPADSIIIKEGDKYSFIDCSDDMKKKEYIKTIFPNCVVSLRNKGMPTTFSDCHKPWLFKDTKKDGLVIEKAALHIRL